MDPRTERSEPPGTFFDTFDGWAKLLRSAESAPPAEVSPAAPAACPDPAAAMPPEAACWRPTRRPAIALLHVVDDGRDVGETIRLRDDSLVVGRSVGGVRIPHDPFLAESHARLDRLPAGDWLLSDLGSDDGTWVRVTTARLRAGLRFLIGDTRLRVDEDAGGLFLTRESAGEPEHRVVPRPPLILGRAAPGWCPPDASASFVALDDPFVSPIHAEILPGRRGWRIHNRGVNGLWVRLESPLRLDATAQFRCGDQRFVLEPAVPEPPPAGGNAVGR